MAVFATPETYLNNRVSFCNSVKRGRILMMPSITYVKTEISTQNTWYPPPYHLNKAKLHTTTFFSNLLQTDHQITSNSGHTSLFQNCIT